MNGCVLVGILDLLGDSDFLLISVQRFLFFFFCLIILFVVFCFIIIMTLNHFYLMFSLKSICCYHTVIRS